MIRVVGVALLVMGCDPDTEPGDGPQIPSDFESTYTEVRACGPSVHPSAEYVRTWISPNGLANWERPVGERGTYDDGVVVLKGQYADENCSSPLGFTVMVKLAEAPEENGGWEWHSTDADLACTSCYLGATCAGCHASCDDYLCTERDE